MSSASRAASRGSKSGKGDHAAVTKAQKPDSKTESGKSLENPKTQPTPEQMRIAQIIEGKSDDPSLKEKIRQVMDATHKSEMEVCTALHDCDYDLDRAVNMLIEGQVSGAWETLVKKKKNRQPSTSSKPETPSVRGVSSADVDSENWEDEAPVKPPVQSDPQQRTRSRGGSGPPRMRGRGSQDNRGWRGRENKENERNLEDGRGAPGSGTSGGEREQRETFRRGAGGGSRGGRMSNGPSRGGGRGGSRSGPRSFSNRGGSDRGGASFPRPTSWNPDEDGADNKSSNFPSPEDWDNEEYTGSLADTKVFTPSTIGGDAATSDPITSLTVNNSSSEPSHAASSGVNSNPLNFSQSSMGSETLSPAQTQYLRQFQDKQLTSSSALCGAMSALSSLTEGADSKTAARGVPPSTLATGTTYNSYAASAANSGGTTVSASYPSSYSSVSASVPASGGPEPNYSSASSVNNSYSTYQTGQSQPSSYTATATSYSTVYGAQTPNYASQDGSPQSSASQPLPARTKTQRPRVPPPSKIPQSAVEMPGDSINNIALLDVQFGALDMGSDAFDTSSSDPQSSPQSQPTHSTSQSQSQQQSVAKYSTGGTSATGLETSSTSTAQSNLDLDPFGAAGSKAVVLSQTLKETLMQSQQQSQSHQPQSSAQQQSNDLKSQQSNYSQQSRGPGSVGVPSPLDSLVETDTSASSAGATGSLAYSNSSSNYQPSSYQSQKNTGSGYPSSVSYNTASYSSSQTSSGVSSASGTYPSNSSANSYATGYPSNVSNQVYQNVNVQSVYGGNSTSNSGYTTSSSGAPYQNSYGTSTAAAVSANKLSSVLNASKDMSQYDSTATSSSNLSSSMASNNSGASGLSVSNVSGSVNNTPALGLPGATSLPNTNNSSTKVTNSSAKSGGVPNMPPGVPPIITGTQYIMSQGGLQYFQQPTMYSYEDPQILPLRLGPPMTAGYYDLTFQQAPTSLTTGRDGSLANVPYSMSSDGRFTRTDNASPVPSSLSQPNATQAHQQPMMNAAGFPPGYTYAYYSGSVLPANYQYGTPTAMYPQVAPTTNAHGNSNTTQYAKPGSYGSSYGSGYDGLSVSQDYSKAGGYAGGHSGAQSGSKTGVGPNAPSSGSSATDLYSKTHVALSKVNSYEKQGFHSGTPPPFNLAGNQNTGIAPSGAYPPPIFIPSIPHQQHHSTTLIPHTLHQQMDLRNPARRSESGNSSGQRSQTSAQSNKPGGTKQTFSPSYWQS